MRDGTSRISGASQFLGERVCFAIPGRRPRSAFPAGRAVDCNEPSATLADNGGSTCSTARACARGAVT
jgi:hypothetical protein